MFAECLLQGRFPRREFLLALQVFQRVEARFFDAFEGGGEGAFDEVEVAAVAVADEFGVDEPFEERGDVLFESRLSQVY